MTDTSQIDHPYYQALNRKRGPSRKLLFVPLGLFVVLLIVHAVYWFYAAGRIQERGEAWVAEQQAAGYEISYHQLRVTGYPFRFTLRARDPEIVAPAADGGWRADMPRFAASAQLFSFNHWILTFGSPLNLETEIDGTPARYAIEAEQARVSLAGADGATDRIGAEIDALTIATTEGPRPAVSALGAVRLNGRIEDGDRLHARIEANGAQLAAGLLSEDVSATFGPEISRLRLDAELTEWNELAAEGDLAAWTRAGGRILVNAAQMLWGPAEVAGEGDISLGEDFTPSGRLSVIVTDPDVLVGALVEAGLVAPDQGEALQLAAMMAPRRGGGLALPFRLQNGGIFLGPARLGGLSDPD
ncbi:hypothetical protein DDZ18_13045 [Marinicauda salina]|uniref:DUF2125 domain-containing protein n=1 Tax=Marinicauda salina TaxID=2135793 RepID=A0A2U2BQR6_9PROT|nr:DUF2125 domain-containing protein [Marinicauda salina]PWE16345.1 hypothetical protein DDZ18_13045 [Marinicauda salina]